jgi:transcriptional regulator MraZ
LKAPLFYNTFDLKIDAKNRLFIPATVRKLIDPEIHGKAFFVILGRNRRPWLYPERYYESLVSTIPAEMTPDDDMLAYTHLKFSLADRIEWDEQGRVVFPEKMLRRAQIDKDITLAGAWDHLELWNRHAWEAHSNELVDRSPDLETKARERLKASAPSQP